MQRLFLVLLLSLVAVSASGQTSPGASEDRKDAFDPAGLYSQIHLPEKHVWPGVMLVIVLWMFIAALVIGVVVRANASPEPDLDADHP